jgi:hypothetical protein
MNSTLSPCAGTAGWYGTLVLLQTYHKAEPEIAGNDLEVGIGVRQRRVGGNYLRSERGGKDLGERKRGGDKLVRRLLEKLPGTWLNSIRHAPRQPRKADQLSGVDSSTGVCPMGMKEKGTMIGASSGRQTGRLEAGDEMPPLQSRSWLGRLRPINNQIQFGP